MLIHVTILAASLAGQAELEPEHRGNPVYASVLREGLHLGAESVTLPHPLLRDGLAAEQERAAARQVAGSDSHLDELFRDSVTAPYIIKVHDRKTPEATIRSADLWFVVYAGLDQIDPAREAARSDQKEVEAANMWFQSRLLKPEELRAAGIQSETSDAGKNRWYAHLHARLLDRIDFEVTNHVVATQSRTSMVVAAQTDPHFAREGASANVWKSLAKASGGQNENPARPYQGGISYAKMSRVQFKPGAVFVEMHMAFVEPTEWFQGAPILRSKFSVVAQDQIRALRRELSRKH
jgi:hypothetical protein